MHPMIVVPHPQRRMHLIKLIRRDPVVRPTDYPPNPGQLANRIRVAILRTVKKQIGLCLQHSHTIGAIRTDVFPAGKHP